MSYIRQTWIDNQTTVTAAHMQHIEDGIIADGVRIDALQHSDEDQADTIRELEVDRDQLKADLTDVVSAEHNRNDGIKPLFIKTPFEYNEPLHPSVLFIPNGFNGYRFWMVETPLPLSTPVYRDRYECPCIHASNDGVDWVTPSGLTNPIDDLTESEITNKDYFSDPCLVYRPTLNRIEVWYRITRASDRTYGTLTLPTQLVRKYSYDGISWSERELMNDFSLTSSPLYPMVRSMAVLHDGNKYQMWFVDGMVNGLPESPLTIRYSDSTDGKNWTTKRTCTLWNAEYIPWHIDVQYDNGTFHMITYNRGSENNGVESVAHYASSDGINWNFINLLDYSRYNFVSADKSFYKSCAVKVGLLWYAYLTCVSDKKVSIALMIGDKLSNMQYYQGTENDNVQTFIKGLRLAYSQKYGAHNLALDYRSKLMFEKDNTNYAAIQLDADGNIVFGSFTGNQKILLYGGNSKTIVQSANIIPSETKAFNIGDVNHKIKDLWVGGTFRTPLYQTSQRPTDVTTGAMIYDINLAKPIWFNGSNWIDASGTIV